jgi:methionyl-tRNA formyltransferase
MGRKVIQMPPRELQDIKILFLGMSGEFSYLVLEGLLDAAIDVCAVVIPAAAATADLAPIIRLDPEPPRSQLPINRPYLQPNINHLAWQNQIPVYELRHLSAPEVVRQLAALKADVAIVACFPELIPDQILTIPPHGFLNLHPSLLPDLRGPFPLFWSFRLGQHRSGVTVHHMDAGMDTGAIALQQEIFLPDGITGPKADALFATHGALLLQTACRQIAAGTVSRRSQPAGGSTYSRPTVQDFHIPITWSARHAFNFICGTAERRQPYRIIGQGIELSLRHAISFDAAATQPEPLLRDGRDCWIQFSPGVLHAR